jgi:hypothetical protein
VNKRIATCDKHTADTIIRPAERARARVSGSCEQLKCTRCVAISSRPPINEERVSITIHGLAHRSSSPNALLLRSGPDIIVAILPALSLSFLPPHTRTNMSLRAPLGLSRRALPAQIAKYAASQQQSMATVVPPVTQDNTGSKGPTAMVFMNMGGPSTTDEVGGFLSRLFVSLPARLFWLLFTCLLVPRQTAT